MRITQTAPLVVAALLVWFTPVEAPAQLSAHFQTTQINYESEVDDCDYALVGTPTCELYIQIGVFHAGQLSGDRLDYPDQCGYHSHEDGVWNYPDQEVTASLPNGASGAYVYYALLDVDDIDEDDLLGTYSAFFNGTRTAQEWNNNLLPPGYSVTSCDAALVDNDRYSNRFTFDFKVWFTDDSAPGTIASVQHNDADSPPGWDNDLRLDFSWTAATDIHSGISEYELELEKDGVVVIATTRQGTSTSVAVCSGCSINHAVADGSAYQLRLRARNGGGIDLENPAWSSWSGWSTLVFVDTDYPVTTIDAPPPGSWQNGDFTVVFTDTDEFLSVCQFRVNDGSWNSRACSGTETVSVGDTPGKDCAVEGFHSLELCVVEARSFDGSGNGSATASRSFSIDYTPDSVTNIGVATESGGDAIDDGSWTMDRDPFFFWSAETSTSPIEGYSYAVNSDPDCETLELSGPSVTLPGESLVDGMHNFRVRPVDEAGNCGPVFSKTVRVDGSAEIITSLKAYTEPAGSPINPGEPQEDNTPYFQWTPSASVSPIIGYSYSIDGPPDCEPDTPEQFTTLDPLPDGTITFQVRPIDTAGNCGSVAGFDIVVQRPEVIFSSGFELETL